MAILSLSWSYGKGFSITPLNLMLAVSSSSMSSIYSPVCRDFWSRTGVSRCLIFPPLCIDTIKCFFFFILLMWWITLLGFRTFKQFCRPGTNPALSQCLNLWEHCWAGLTNLMPRIHCIRRWTVIFFVAVVMPPSGFLLRKKLWKWVSCKAFSQPLWYERFCVMKVLFL